MWVSGRRNQSGWCRWASDCRTLDTSGAVSRKSRKCCLEGEMVGLRWALRRLGQQGSLSSSRSLGKRERGWQLVGRREYSSAGRGIGVWGACFDGGQPHQVLLTFQKESCQSFKCQGTGEAPRLLREAGLLRRLREGGCSVTDHGDLVSVGPLHIIVF